MPSGGFLAALAAAAEFVETKRRKRTNQCKTCGERKEQRQHRITKHQSEQEEAKNRIHHAKDDGVTWYGLEIFPPQTQRLAQIGQADRSNDSWGGDTERV